MKTRLFLATATCFFILLSTLFSFQDTSSSRQPRLKDNIRTHSKHKPDSSNIKKDENSSVDPSMNRKPDTALTKIPRIKADPNIDPKFTTQAPRNDTVQSITKTEENNNMGPRLKLNRKKPDTSNVKPHNK